MWDKLKRWISLTLVAVMFISMLPMDALADASNWMNPSNYATFAERLSTQAVYMFVKIEGNTYGMSLNKDGWFTVGTINVDNMPTASWDYDSYDEAQEYEDQVIKAISGGTYTLYTPNAAVFSDTSIFGEINWQGGGAEAGGLIASYGAAEYGGTEMCWHIDGYLKIDYKYFVKHYLEDSNGDVQFNGKKYSLKTTNTHLFEALSNTVVTGESQKATFVGYEYVGCNPAGGITLNADALVLNLYYDKETTSVSGQKTWIDGNNGSNTRPESITVKLMNGNSVVDTKTVTAADNWKYEFTNLPTYENGVRIQYSVQETQVNGYEPEYDGYDITNKITDPGNIEVSGTKTWVDGGKVHDNTSEITLTLYRTSQKPGAQEETLSDTPAWNDNTYKFSGLELYDADGYAYDYRVAETGSPDGYDQSEPTTGNFVNTIHDAANKEVSGTKTWVDGGKVHDNTSEITLTLTRKVTKNGVEQAAEEVTDVTPTWAGNRYTYSNLDKYDDEGYEYTYYVTETQVNGYSAPEYDGYDITNRKNNEAPAIPTKTSTIDDTGVYVENLKQFVKIGGQITYTISYHNHLNTPATVMITDMVPEGTKLVSADGAKENDGIITWVIKDVAPFGNGSVQVTVEVTEDALLNSSIKNTARVAIGDSKMDAVADSIPVFNPHLTVSKTTTSKPAPDAEGNPKTTYALGETITYEIEVKNDGNLTITDIAVEDVLTGNTGDQAWKIDSLAPDESRVFEASYTVTEADIHTGSVVNEATATGKTKDEANPEVPVTPGKTVDKTEEPFAKLDIAKAIVNGKESYRIGESIQYLITVTNTGNVTVEDIEVTDYLTSPANETGKVETIELDQGVAPGESVTVEYTYTIQKEDVLPPYAEDGETVLRHYVDNYATVKGTGVDEDRTLCEATSEKVTAEAEHMVYIRFIDSQTGTILKGDLVPYGGSTTPPAEREVPDYPGYDFTGWWGGIWENVYTDQNVFTKYVRREGWYPPRENDNGTGIIDAEIPLAGGYISNVGDCFD